MKQIFLSITALVSFIACTYAQNSSPYWSLAGNSNATSSSKLGTTNAIDLRFFTNNSERARITSAGNVGIGTTSPSGRLTVNSAAGANAFRAQVGGNTKFLVHSSGGVAIGSNSAPPSDGLYVLGSVGIGTATPISKLHVEGNGRFTNTLYISDGGITSLNSSGNYGIYSFGNYAGVFGSGGTYGVYGNGTDYAVYGTTINGYGVYGTSSSGYGGYFNSNTNHGIWARTGSTSATVYAGVFQGKVYTYNSYQTSDKNLKKNIQDFGEAMSIIKKLKPKNYDFRNDGKYASLQLPKGNHYGLLAQDLEQVLPNLVNEAPIQVNTGTQRNIKTMKLSADGKTSIKSEEQQEITEIINTKAINYTELIPIVIKGMQELSKENEDLKKKTEDQQKQIEELKLMVKFITNQGPATTITSSAFLKQSVPNPSADHATIAYYAPNDSRSVQILVTDMKGRAIKAFTTAKGEGRLIIRRGELPAGTYNYTLYVNNNKIETKQMILVR